MKKLKKLWLHFLLSSLFVISASAYAQHGLEQLWVTPGLSVPESVLVYYNGKSSYLLVSQIDGEPSTADGKGGIAKMNLNGEIEDLNWVTGLNAPKGMAIFKNNLYVADINQLVIINLKSAEIEKKITIPGAKFLNDVAVDAKGVLYISDTQTNKVYRYKSGQLDDYVVNIEEANGLKILGSNLIVGAGTHLFLIDKTKNKLPIASGFAQSIDGVESIGQGNFIVSCWQGLLYYVYLNGKIELLLNTLKEGINAADIGFDSHTQTVFVPNFSKNSVTAYKIIKN